MKKGAELVDLDVVIIAETEKAWLVNHDGQRAWIPKSVGEIEHKGYPRAELTLPTAYAEDKGLV